MADVVERQTWDVAFKVPPETLKNWQTQLNPGQSLLQFCLLHGHLPESKYFPWAMGNFQLPRVRKEFFSIPPDLVFWELVKNRFAWSAELVPLAEWEGVMMVGCLSPPTIRIPMPHQIVLASAGDLLKHWNSYNGVGLQAASAAGLQAASAAALEPASPAEVTEAAPVAGSTQPPAHGYEEMDPVVEPSGVHESALLNESSGDAFAGEIKEDTNSLRLPGERTRAEFEALVDDNEIDHEVAHEVDHASNSPASSSADESDSASHVAAASIEDAIQARVAAFQEDHDSTSESELNSQDGGTGSMISISIGAQEGSGSGFVTAQVDTNSSFSLNDENTQLDEDSAPHFESDGEGSAGQSDEARGETESENHEEAEAEAEAEAEEEEIQLLEGLNFDTSKAASLDFSALLGGTSPAPVEMTAEPVSNSSAPSFLDSFAESVVEPVAQPVAQAAAQSLTASAAVAQTPSPDTHKSAASTQIPTIEIPESIASTSKNATAQPLPAKAEPVLAKMAASADLPPIPVSEFKSKPAAPPVKPGPSLFEEAKQAKATPPPVEDVPIAASSNLDPVAARRVSVTQMAISHETSSTLDNSMLTFVSQISEANHSPLAHLAIKELSACQTYDELALQTLLRVQAIFEHGMILMFQEGQLRPWKWTDMILSIHGTAVKPIQIQDASIFRIVLRTSLPYHGYVVPNPVNDAFFNDFNRGKTPSHVTLVPILIERQTSGIIMGLSDVEVDYKTSLSRMQDLAKQVSTELKRMRQVKVA